MPRNLTWIAILVALVLASCSGSDEDQSRDHALAALERATGTASLQAEMAALIEALPAESTAAQATQLAADVEELDATATELLVSSDGSEEFDREIDSALEQTQSAGRQLTAAAKKPAKLTSARKRAAARLKVSNRELRIAVEQIDSTLEGEGELSAEDAEAFDAALADVQQARRAVTAAEREIARQQAEAAREAAEEAAAQQAAEEAAAAAEAAPAGCPPGSTISPSGRCFGDFPGGGCDPVPGRGVPCPGTEP